MNGNRSCLLVPLLTLALVIATSVLLVVRQRTARPTAQLSPELQSVGANTVLGFDLEAPRGKLDTVELAVRQGDRRVVVITESLGATDASMGWGATMAADSLGLAEGPATLELVVRDAFWRPLGPGDEPTLTWPIVLDFSAPALAVSGASRYPQQGGAGIAILTSEPDARVEVICGDQTFVALAEANSGRHVAVFTLRHDHPVDLLLLARATDAAGNVSQRELPSVIRRGEFKTGQVTLKQEFLERKLPELLPNTPDLNRSQLADAFLRVNRDLRQQAAGKKHELARQTTAHPQWRGAFVQPRNTQVFSNYAETRDYRFDGDTLDTQVHLGFDLASTRQAPVPSAQAGTVVHAGPLTIYGNTVVVDHGLGVQTLYAHLSSFAVETGAQVGRGTVLGRTGTTGLAVGDHLHYEVLVQGYPTNPLQWWDGRWMRDHLDGPLVDANSTYRVAD